MLRKLVNRTMVVSLGFALMVLLLTIFAFTISGAEVKSGLTVRDGKLYRNGKVYRGIGVNYCDLFQALLNDPVTDVL